LSPTDWADQADCFWGEENPLHFGIAEMEPVGQTADVMKKFLMTLMACVAFAAPVQAQALVWEVDAAAILPNAAADMCVVKIDTSNRAWVILQNGMDAKLVRVGSKGQTQVWTLPASDYEYGLRAVGKSSAVVQAAGNVTRVVSVQTQFYPKKLYEWRKTDVVLPEEAAQVKYVPLAEDEGSGKVLWYFTTDEDGKVSKVVLRGVP
jgi:hypothetical protein